MKPSSTRSAVLRHGAGLARLALVLWLIAPWVAARAQQPVRLRVAGASASNEVKLRTTSEDFRHVLRVDLLTVPGAEGEEPLPGGVTVLVDPLQSQDGVQVPLTATMSGAVAGGTTALITARQPLQVELSGRLPAVGDYTGQVVLLHAGGRETTALTVTRVQAVPAVQFVAASPAVASSGWGWSTVDATVRLPFKETAGVSGRISSPRLLQLQRKAPDLGAVLVQPDFAEARFTVEGAPPGGDSQDAVSFPLEAHGSGALVLSLRGLDGPGEYTGTVRISVPSGAPVEQTFTVWVRSPWTWGALLIALGALSSYAVRLYSQRIRPRALRLQRALALRRRLQSLMSGQDAEAREVGRAVRGRIDALVSEIRKPVRGIRVGDAELAAVEPRLRLYEAWCDAARKVRALPEEVRPPQASQVLAAAEEALRGEDVSAEQLEAQLKAVRELDVAGLARAGLEARLQDIDKQARTLAKQRGEEDTLGFRLTYELLPLLGTVRDALAGPDLAAARQQLELARRSYFDILCAELSTAVAALSPPRGFTADEWKELTADVKERLRQARARADASVDDAFRLYQGAHAIYVRRLVMELRKEVEQAREEADTDEQRTLLDEVGAKLREALGALAAESPHEAAMKYGEARDALHRAHSVQVRQRILALRADVAKARAGTTEQSQLNELGAIDRWLEEARAALDAEAPQEAALKYERARKALQSYPSPQRVTAGQVVLESFTAGGVEQEASAPTGGSIPSLPESPMALPPLGELDGLPLPSPRHLWLVELGVLVLLTGLAVALGLQLLNVFSPTWGGFGAGMTAFLWGFGLHQVGNATFEGLTGLLTRVERQGSSSSS
ncbi:hypothetical protein [Myxococcus sp. RHSTA-1-4]|uniref:hypothetical protein n=1 Tax=Myxococcus sp. RHSTA-1-4 TaxID=2874601 RepID=UPI001CC123C0|nr:hypothetical protein [Myxococcus sp. RHSTA-1-4]MBZ4418802.1 hypothetical protein [Myxococcus sp. RHSTA-1-4]